MPSSAFQTCALRSEEHTSELQSHDNILCRLLLEKNSEVTRVAREGVTEGKLGSEADVKGVAGTWKDLTDSVNSMAGIFFNEARTTANFTLALPMALPS